MAVTGLQEPNFRTVTKFRARHLVALSGSFVQVLTLCRKAGLPRLITPEARWGLPDRRQFDAHPVFGDDQGRKTASET